MNIVNIQDWILEIDAEKTKEFYDKIKVEDGCNCSYCRNYIMACETFPKEVMDFFTMLGIDPRKEGEFIEWGIDNIGHLYTGFYHLVGKIINKPNKAKDFDDLKAIEIDNFKFYFTDDLDLVPKNFPKPVIQLNFEVTLPWLLDDK